MTTAALPTAAPVTVDSQVLGTIQVTSGDLMTVPAGLFGFPDAKRFALLPTPREGLFWLQSLDFSALAFLLVDPFPYFPDRYRIDLGSSELTKLGSPAASDLLVLSIVTMPTRRGEACTANLQAPLLINLRDRHAFQSIRPDDGFSVREAFDLDQLVGEST